MAVSVFAFVVSFSFFVSEEAVVVVPWSEEFLSTADGLHAVIERPRDKIPAANISFFINKILSIRQFSL